MGERILDQASYPVVEAIYLKFIEYEDGIDYLVYGEHPEDWYPSYQLFLAGYQAGEQSKMALVLQQREQLARLLVP